MNLSGADWATAGTGICTRCSNVGVLVLGRFHAEPENRGLGDEDFDVPLCPRCHPGWPATTARDLPLGRTMTGVQLEALAHAHRAWAGT